MIEFLTQFMAFCFVTGAVLFIRWFIMELRNAPLMPDCYGEPDCNGLCSACRFNPIRKGKSDEQRGN